MIAGLRLLRGHLRGHRLVLAMAVAAMVGEVATTVLVPIPLQQIIDTLVTPAKHRGAPVALTYAHGRHLVLLALLAVAIAVLDAAFTYLDLRQTSRVAQIAATGLRRQLFAHTQRLSISFHQHPDTRGGDLMVRMNGDVQVIQDAAATSVSSVVTNGAAALLMLMLLLRVDVRIWLLVLGTSVPVFAVMRHYHGRLKQATRMARRHEGRVSAMLSESLGASKLVQAFGREEHETRRLHAETEQGMAYGLRVGEYQARSQPIVALVTSVCVATVLLVGAILAMQRTITVGQLTLVVAYTKGIFGSLRQLAKVSNQATRVASAAERVADLLDRSSDVVDPVHPLRLPRGRGLDIRFSGVSFGYTPGRPVLRDIDLAVPAGATLAVVGPTGAGKSTLAALVPRFHDPWSGRVEVGGLDVRSISLDELRSNVALVLQDTLLLRASVFENIAYGRPDASAAEVLAAAESAGVARFVDQLEAGYDTLVSERGTTLSGGQKQCVAIARAMLRDSPIVILDEPTSSLDARSEELVVAALRQLVTGRTAVIIAHRFSTIRHADLVAVVAGGRLRQLDSPAELEASGDGLYAELSQLQRSG